MVTRLNDAEIEARLSDLTGWTRQGDVIRKTFQLPSFPSALSFVVNVGFLAEAASHHPAIDIRWRKVTLSLTTQDAGGLSQKDFDLALQLDELV